MDSKVNLKVGTWFIELTAKTMLSILTHTFIVFASAVNTQVFMVVTVVA